MRNETPARKSDHPSGEGARRATAQDLPTLVRLARDALGGLATARGGNALIEVLPFGGDLDADFARLLDDPHFLVLLGTYEGVGVGFLLLSGPAVGKATGGTARIDLLFVEPAARQVGVGETLHRAARSWCLEKGILDLDALVLPGDRLGKSFFEMQGLRARLLVMQQTLEQ